MKKLALCQPYFSPYLGYFQLINAVDVYVSYDDVNFIKGGWINRNRVKVNGSNMIFNIPLIKQSSFKKINETYIDWDNRGINKFLKTINQSYNKSPHRDNVMDILDSIFKDKPLTIADLSLLSIKEFCKYLDIKTEIKTASTLGYDRTNDKMQNIVNICNQENALNYINPIGGTKLYDKEEFKKQNIKLNFIEGTSSLSIIDECLNNTKEEVKQKLTNYKLI